jgi:hypothetical protein
MLNNMVMCQLSYTILLNKNLVKVIFQSSGERA